MKNSFIENKKAGVSLQGHSGQKTSFSGTAIHGELSNAYHWLPFCSDTSQSQAVRPRHPDSQDGARRGREIPHHAA